MTTEVLTAANPGDRALWHAHWLNLPAERRDVYFLPGYLLANEADGRGEARCFIARSDDALLLYPFLLNAVPDLVAMDLGRAVYDLQTPYGYGGPVVNTAGERPGFLEAAWLAFSEWCRTAAVVAEFCRFHPILENERWAGPSMRVVPNRETVLIDLTTYPTEFETSAFYRTHRQMVSKARRSGYTSDTVPAQSEMGWFAACYERTQDLLGAGSETRFGEAYFRTLADALEQRALVRVVRREGRTSAAILLLAGDLYAHAHLMVYGDDRVSAGVTNEAQHSAALDLAARGFKLFHIGGGLTSDPADSLLKFKERLSPGRKVFRIGMRCHQPDVYDQMRRAWEARHGALRTDFFLFYRLV